MSKHVCKYCGKEFETAKQLGGHVSCCNKNPNHINKINKAKETIKLKKHIYTIKCEICGKEFQLELTENTFNKGKYKKTCSDSCAKKLTAKHTNKQNKSVKLRKTIQTNTIIRQFELAKQNNRICEICGKHFFYKKGNPYNTYNSSKYSKN